MIYLPNVFEVKYFIGHIKGDILPTRYMPIYISTSYLPLTNPTALLNVTNNTFAVIRAYTNTDTLLGVIYKIHFSL